MESVFSHVREEKERATRDVRRRIAREVVSWPKMIFRVRGRPVLVYLGANSAARRIHHAPAGSQDQAFACDHTCVIPINIAARARTYVCTYMEVEVCVTRFAELHADYPTLRLTRAQRLTD